MKDVVEICLFLMEREVQSGIYNLGSGKARTFLDLVKNTFAAMGKEERISVITSYSIHYTKLYDAMTYVVAALGALVTLIYFILSFAGASED